MIEVVHYTNRYGKQMVGVFGVKTMEPMAFKYDERYAAGLEPAYYPVPAIIYHVYLPSVSGKYGSVWEYSRFSCEPYEITYNKRVHVYPPPPVDPQVYAAHYYTELLTEILSHV